MRMGVDKAREDDGSPLAARGSARLAVRGSAFAADGDDATAVDFDPSVADWRRVDGQNPVRRDGRGTCDTGPAQCPGRGGLSFRTRSARG